MIEVTDRMVDAAADYLRSVRPSAQMTRQEIRRLLEAAVAEAKVLEETGMPRGLW